MSIWNLTGNFDEKTMWIVNLKDSTWFYIIVEYEVHYNNNIPLYIKYLKNLSPFDSLFEKWYYQQFSIIFEENHLNLFVDLMTPEKQENSKKKRYWIL